jgi:dihydroorotate dehydrogenase
MSIYKTLRPLIFSLPPETGHNIAIAALKYGLVQFPRQQDFPQLKTELFGLKFNNPVGLAAGFDKNGEAISALLNRGFGFIEVGTCTPLAQEGNAKPRLFRLAEDETIINRFGFNNKGAKKFATNLKNRPQSGIVGANIGKNKNSTDSIADYLTMMEEIDGLSDYITVNISSPNTPGLRDLQGKEELDKLLGAIISKRAELKSKETPILLKISPDIDEHQRSDIAEIVLKHSIDGLIISNTTISQRDSLLSKQAHESGGLSGRPLFKPSTEILRDMYRLTERKIPIIGVGGIFSGDDAYNKIKAGASLVQIYSAIIYEGFGLIPRINERLCELLHKDGLKNISEAVGVDVT